jgi:hypothetical protein
MRVMLSIFAACALLLSGCGIRIGDPGPAGEVGVSKGDDTILLRVQPCANTALVKAVALRIGTGKAGVEGPTVWQITSRAGSPLREYEVGQTPSGFVETVPLAEIEPDKTYVAVVTRASPGLDFLTAFVPASLDPTVWEISTNDRLTEAEFDRLQPCG